MAKLEKYFSITFNGEYFKDTKFDCAYACAPYNFVLLFCFMEPKLILIIKFFRGILNFTNSLVRAGFCCELGGVCIDKLRMPEVQESMQGGWLGDMGPKKLRLPVHPLFK